VVVITVIRGGVSGVPVGNLSEGSSEEVELVTGIESIVGIGVKDSPKGLEIGVESSNKAIGNVGNPAVVELGL